MKHLTIQVPDMQSAHCQARVNKALEAIEGLKVEELEAGRISVSVERPELEAEVLKAIEHAGYTVNP